MNAVRKIVTFITLLVTIAGGFVFGTSTASAQTPTEIDLVYGQLTCSSVYGEFEYQYISDTYTIVVDVYNWDTLDFTTLEYDIPDGSTGGVVEFELPFPTQEYGEWVIEIYTLDEFGDFDDTYFYLDRIERECVVGYVGSGGTGSDDDAAAPTDARSDATTEVEEEEPVEDPDGDGRVQVP